MYTCTRKTGISDMSLETMTCSYPSFWCSCIFFSVGVGRHYIRLCAQHKNRKDRILYISGPYSISSTFQLATTNSFKSFDFSRLKATLFYSLCFTTLHFEHDLYFLSNLTTLSTFVIIAMTPPLTGFFMRAAGLGQVHKEIEKQKREGGMVGYNGMCCLMFLFPFLPATTERWSYSDFPIIADPYRHYDCFDLTPVDHASKLIWHTTRIKESKAFGRPCGSILQDSGSQLASSRDSETHHWITVIFTRDCPR